MALTINTNVTSLNAQRNVAKTQNALAESVQRLSTGLRINSAKDDAAGLAISERLTTQVRGQNVAIRNANDGISLAQTAESSLVEVSNSLQRVRELAIQAKNGTNSADDRAALLNEMTELLGEIARVGNSSNFNGINLLNGSAGSAMDGKVDIQVGSAADETVQLDLSKASMSTIFSNATPPAPPALATAAADGDLLMLDAGKFKANDKFFGTPATLTAENSKVLIERIDTSLTNVNNARASLGASQNRLSSVINSLGNSIESASASRSRILDADFAAETAALTKQQILQQSGIAQLSQANQIPQSVLKLLQ